MCSSTSPRRFIPTPVGNTSAAVPPGSLAAVHPHARGEHVTVPAYVSTASGSSPRPWGTQPLHHEHLRLQRFIPTPVGNTCGSARRHRRRPVHPHARGEHGNSSASGCSGHGSSPRPWGTLPCRWVARRCDRFIPTPVGNTACAATRPAPAPVHPHARGEHSRSNSRSFFLGGSSPRPWGTRAHVSELHRQLRFIPTPVGNTWTARPTAMAGTVHPHARGEHTTTR